MKKIGDITSTADKNGEFTDGNVAAGTPPTQLMGAWFNSVQREVLNVLSLAGINQSPKEENQLAKSIVKIIENANFQPSGNYLKVGDGGWMRDTGVPLTTTQKLSDYRLNSISYAWSTVSKDTFKGLNNIFLNMFGYLNNNFGAQLAVIPSITGGIGYRVISDGVVGEWMELARISYVDSAIKGLISSEDAKTELDKKLNTSDVTQTTGTSTTKVPSQNAVTTWVNDRYTKGQTDTLLNNKMNNGHGGWMTNRGVALTSESKLSDYRMNSIGYAWGSISSDLFLNANNIFLNLFGYTDSTYGAQLSVLPLIDNERIGFRVIQNNNVGKWIEFATRGYVDSVTLGKGQKYYSDTKSAGTTYTNTSSSAIHVCVSIIQQATGGQANIAATVDGVIVQRQSCYARDTYASVSFIVPPGSSYKVDKSSDTPIANWSELR